MKKINGITLIALVITIIVLLILAGVALATLTGQGNIIGNAENAVGKYNEEVSTEQKTLNAIEKFFMEKFASKNGTYYGGTGGSPNGRNGTQKSGSGHSNTLPNQGGFPLAFTIGSGSYGSGGGAVCSSHSSYITSGGSGGYNTGYIDVVPNTTYTITVGAGGLKGDTDDSRAHGYDGTSGFVLIAYGGDI